MRPPGCENKRTEETTDAKMMMMLGHAAKHGVPSWNNSDLKKPGVRRCGKSCKLRWSNGLRPEMKQESFTGEEEELIIKLHSAIGSRWSIIAQQLPGRTDNDVKNYWNTSLKKKLKEKGIDPITHRPFSHILRDYENIGGTSSAGTRMESMNRDLRTAFVPGVSFSHNQIGLLAQLQSIKLVTETSIGGCSSFPSPPPSSSSSATSSESPVSGWSEFLLADDMKEEEEVKVDQSACMGVVEKMKGFENEIHLKEFQSFPETTGEGSFVETMLKRDREMYFMEFPELWEEPHY